MICWATSQTVGFYLGFSVGLSRTLTNFKSVQSEVRLSYQSELLLISPLIQAKSVPNKSYSTGKKKPNIITIEMR